MRTTAKGTEAGYLYLGNGSSITAVRAVIYGPSLGLVISGTIAEGLAAAMWISYSIL